MKDKKKNIIEKEDFIAFLANSTPQDLNKLIEEKGKPKRLIDPFFPFPPK